MIKLPELSSEGNKIPNRVAVCEVLMEAAAADRDIIVLCSDSRGSASVGPFFERFPEQTVEVGIAEQNLVGVAAGLARGGKKPFVFSPASFLSARSLEQIKIDCAYSGTNTKLIGISGGVSYGALGMSHHSLQDIAAIGAIPDMRIYIPSDRHQTAALIRKLLKDQKPAYVRLGRGPVEDIYTKDSCPFEMDRAVFISDSNDYDVAIIACGVMVRPAIEAARMLRADHISAAVLDMYCLKPIDQAAVIEISRKSKAIITVEEHSPFGGLGASVSQITATYCPRKVINMSIPDVPAVTGTPDEILNTYGLNAQGIREAVLSALK